MPIQFQPASPGGAFPGIAAEGGRGEAILRTMPVIQQAIEARMRAASAAGDNATRASIAGAEISQRSSAVQGEQALRAAAIGADMAQQQQAQQHAMAMQEAQVQGRIRLMELEPTMQARMQVEQIRTGIAEADRALSVGEIDQNTHAEWTAKARGVMGPLQRRMAEHQMAQEEMQSQAMRASLQKQEMLAQEAAEFRAKALEKRLVTRDVPGVGPTTFYERRPGEWDIVPRKEKGPEAFQMQVLATREKTWSAAFDKAIEYADARIEREIKVGDPNYPDGQSAWVDPENRRGAHEIYFRDYMAKKGLAATWDEEQAAFMRRLGRGQAEQGPAGGMPEGGPPGEITRNLGFRPAPASDAPVQGMERPQLGPAAGGKPFSLWDKGAWDKLTPQQQATVREIGKMQTALRDNRLNPDEVKYGTMLVDTMIAMQQEWGGVAGMPPDQANRYAKVLKHYDELLSEMKKRKPTIRGNEGPPSDPQFATPAGF